MNPAFLELLAARSAAGSWTPASLGASLLAWYDAADAGTITQSGGAVSAWHDKSGAGRHATQLDAGRKPSTGATTQNGLNVLSFAQDNLYAAATFAQPFTAVWVGKFGTEIWTPALSFNADPASYSVYRSTTTFLIYSGAVLNAVVAGDVNPHLFASVHNGASSVVRVDGSQSVGNCGTTGGVYINIGSAVNGSGGITGWIAEIVLASGTLSGADLAAAENYLATKWGVA